MANETNNNLPAALPTPDQVDHFHEQQFGSALQAQQEMPEPTHDDETRMREALLNAVPGEPEELSETRKRILDNPDELRDFCKVLWSHDEALRAIHTSGELTLL